MMKCKLQAEKKSDSLGGTVEPDSWKKLLH